MGTIHKLPNRTPQRDYKSGTGYRFIDKDPMIDFIITQVKASGMSYAAIADKGGACRSTLLRWELGETKRPQKPTIQMTLRAIGLSLAIIDPQGRVLYDANKEK